MDELKLNLKNCYGIQKLNEKVDYSNNNVSIIYAPNGTMKSSLAKTFEAIRDNIPAEEKVYGLSSECHITDENDIDISGNNVIVINPFNENAFENQGILMANDDLRKKYLLIHKSIEEKKQQLYDQIKEKLKYSARSKFDVKSVIMADWNMPLKEKYKCLENINHLLHDSSMTTAISDND